MQSDRSTTTERTNANYGEEVCFMPTTRKIPAKKPTIISIHFRTFFRANPIAYPRSPLPAKGIILDNKDSLLICFPSLRRFEIYSE
jgi:hypothetical protein